MKRWGLRTGTQWGLGMLVALVLALVLGAITLAQLEEIDSSAQRLAMQLLPRAVQAGDLRLQLNRLRSLETGLVRARSLAEVHAYAERFAEQQLNFRAQEVRYAGLLESNDDCERFGLYSASSKDYLRVQQQLLALAHAVDYRSGDSIAATSAALVHTYAGASQGSFAATAATLEQWQHDHAAAAQQASFMARQMAARTRGWMLWTLAGATMLALTLALVLALAGAGARSAGQAKVPSFGLDAPFEKRKPARPQGSWHGTNPQGHSTAVQRNDMLHLAAGAPGALRWSATAAPSQNPRPTRVTAEDWDSF